MAKRRLVIDCETGGLDPNTSSLLTLAAVVWVDGGVQDKILITVNEPEIIASPEAMKVNGLDIEDIKQNGQSPGQAVITLENFLLKNDLRGRQEMVAHNRPFDYGFLQRLYRIAGRDFAGKFSHRGVCTMQTSAFLDLAGVISVRGYSLDLLCKYFNIDIQGREEGLHGALGDAVACAELLTKLIATVRKEQTIISA